MKLLYVASNPEDATSLNLQREITELQRRVLNSAAEPVSIEFFPDLKFEDLPAELHRREPDIIHLAAHGDGESLKLSNSDGSHINVSAEMLRTFMSDRHPPRLVYINACDSNAIAAGLLGTVPMTIGSTAPITNRAARTAAVAFYERILDGSSVARAFDVCQKMMEGAADRSASVRLHCRAGIDPSKETLYAVPMLLAEFIDGRMRPLRGKYYKIRFGLVGCPTSTRQVVFFTDDATFVDDEEDLASDLCTVVRESPKRGVIWADHSDAWEISNDFRLYAIGVSAEGDRYSVSTMISEAIEARYRIKSGGAVPPEVAVATAELRSRGE